MASLFVVAGPNGAGKTTLFEGIIPKGIEYLNTDLIAKDIREQAGGLNVQDLANAEASNFFYNKISNRETFAIETNLADIDTFKSFIELQKKHGYEIVITYLTVKDVSICKERVAQRVKEGGHNVNPDIIQQRYESSLKLLGFYKSFPDSLRLLDNSDGKINVQAELIRGEIKYQNNNLENWVSSIISSNPLRETQKISSIEEAKLLYKSKTIKNKF